MLARAKRAELYGIDAADAGLQQNGSVIGRLKTSKEITDIQHSALQRYFELAERYFSSIGAPDSLRSKGGGSAMRIPDDEADEKLAEKWTTAMGFINEAQKYHRGNLLAALQFMVIRDEFFQHMLGDLRIASNALVRYYKLS